MDTESLFLPCVLIPVYNHEHAVPAVVENIIIHGIPCILVDDGSSRDCADILDSLAEKFPDNIHLLRHKDNQGKGEAVMTGIRYAEKCGFTHALQIDADGQHDTRDIPLFISLARQFPDAIINGCPVYDGSVPTIRYFCRYITHVWVWINTLSFKIKDSMCGFRLYPVSKVMLLSKKHHFGSRMTFDTDIIVRLFWEGLDVVNVPTKVSYPIDGVSHFRGFRDNVQICFMHARLFFGMLLRFPRLIGYWWR